MDTKTITDIDGRKYEVYQEGELTIEVGPPRGLVDILELPEPFATKMHNALHARKLFNYAAINKDPRSLQGALQETLMLDVQRISAEFYKYELSSG